MSENPYIVAGDALEGTSCGDYEVSSAIVDALYWAGCIQTDPRIIRTVEELEALDPDTVMQPPLDELGLWPNAMSARSLKWSMRTWDLKYLPAVVIVPGEQVRAARKALEKETE